MNGSYHPTTGRRFGVAAVALALEAVALDPRVEPVGEENLVGGATFPVGGS